MAPQQKLRKLRNQLLQIFGQNKQLKSADKLPFYGVKMTQLTYFVISLQEFSLHGRTLIQTEKEPFGHDV